MADHALGINQITRHGFSDNGSHLLRDKLDKGVSARVRRFLAPAQFQSRHFTKLTKKSRQLCFFKTFGNVTKVNDTRCVTFLDGFGGSLSIK